jgi:hypothetical protein
MRVRFLADVNLKRGIVDGVRRQESLIDFQRAHEAGLTGKNDLEVLEVAASLQRLLVTHDRKTMPIAFGRFIENQSSFGVLIVPQNLPLRIGIEELLLIWVASEAEEWINLITPIPL